MSFINKIEKVISEAVEEYNLQLSDKYGLDPCELDELWASVMNSSVKNKTVTNPTPKVVSKPKPTPKESGCPYTFTKGKREGEVCGSQPKSGSSYCSRHAKYEGKDTKDTKEKKTSTSIKKSVAPPKKARTPESNNKKSGLTLRLNRELNKYWHSETGMVFKSAKEREVIGRCVNGNLLELTDSDREVCMAHGFRISEVEESEVKESEVKESEVKESEVEEVDNEVSKEKIPEKKEDDLEEEEELEDDDTDPVRKVTKVPSSLLNKSNEKKTSSTNKLNVKKATHVKKSVMAAINYTNTQAADIEEVLSELQIPAKCSFPGKGEDNDGYTDEEEIFEEEEEEEEFDEEE